jgi:hypothetical protein
MATVPLEDRVAALEAEVERIKARIEGGTSQAEPGWKKLWGTFANDSMYQEAMLLGREFRESQRPKPSKRRKR